MALAVAIRFDFLDGKGKTSSTKIRVPNGFTIAQYVEAAQAFAELISQFSQCQITNASITVGLDLSSATLRAAALLTSDIYHKARFQFATAVNGFRTAFNLPTFNEAKAVTGSDQIDQADIDVAALIAALENGIVVTGGTIAPTDHRTNDVVSIEHAREIFRKKS